MYDPPLVTVRCRLRLPVTLEARAVRGRTASPLQCLDRAREPGGGSGSGTYLPTQAHLWQRYAGSLPARWKSRRGTKRSGPGRLTVPSPEVENEAHAAEPGKGPG